MSRRTIRAGLAGGIAAALTLLGVAAHADPNPVPDPGTPLTAAGKTDSQLYAGVGADAFAELTNNVVDALQRQPPARPPARVVRRGQPGDRRPRRDTSPPSPAAAIARPNGANAGVTAILLNQKSTVRQRRHSYCVDFVRSSRAKGTAAGEANLTFYAQSRDAVSYATIGNAYAPTTPLTTAQLKDIFECTDTDWSQVGGQAGAIHVYLPPDDGRDLHVLPAGDRQQPRQRHHGLRQHRRSSQQQNDGRTLNGDPQGIAPYAVTKWAAQEQRGAGHRRQPRWRADRAGQHHDRTDHDTTLQQRAPTRC